MNTNELKLIKVDKELADIVQDQGDITQLNTTDKSSIVNAIKEVKSQANSKADQVSLNTTNTNESTLQSQVAGLSNGAPVPVTLASQMTDPAKNYNYMGSETGYTAGHLYYWNGSAWADGGVYQAMAIAPNSVQHTNMFMSYIRGSIVYGGIDINIDTKTITISPYTRISYAMGDCVEAVNSTALLPSVASYIFFNLNNNRIEAYEAGNFTGLGTTYNNLIWIGTVYIDKIFDIINTTFWTLNGKKIATNYVSIIDKQVIMSPSTPLGSATYYSVIFDEPTNSIKFPPSMCVIVGSEKYETTVESAITLNKAEIIFSYRALILFDTLTKTFSIKLLDNNAYSIPNTTTILGSFLINWADMQVQFQYIQANFPYMLNSVNPSISSYWNGKKANFIGDSITEGGAGNYVNVVKSILGLSIARNYGIGGDSLAYRNSIYPNPTFGSSGNQMIDAAYPPVISRWQTMDNDADIIFMLIGTNDYTSQVPLGTDTSTNTNEFKGCLNIVLKGLRDKYPTKMIVVSTLLNRVSHNELTIKIEQYNQAIIDMCKKYRIICYDAYTATGMDLEYDENSLTEAITIDGLHPNPTGAGILGRSIAGFINSH
jgi:lysophospholipase L1-like esterase